MDRFQELSKIALDELSEVFARMSDENVRELFEEIKNGEYIDENFRRTMQFTTNSEKNTQFSLNANTDKKAGREFLFGNRTI